jgi:putative zinc finger protein
VTEHLSPAQIEDWRRRLLAPDELLRADDHLAGCVECRQRIETALSCGAGEMALYAQLSAEADALWRPTFGQLAGYVDGLLTGDERQVVNDHLVACARCAAIVGDLRAFRNEIAQELDREYLPEKAAAASASWPYRIVAALRAPFFEIPPWVYAAATVLLLLGVGWMARRAALKHALPQIAITSPTPAPSPSVNSTPPTPPTLEASPALARLNDGDSSLTFDAQGRLAGVDRWPAAYQQLAKDALSNQRVERSPMLVGLSRQESSLMGGDDQVRQFAIIEPAGKVTLTARPTLRWSRLSGATGYIVEIYDAGFKRVSASPSLTDVSWTPPPLARGRAYSWQVRAVRDGQEFNAPRPPAPQARFRILDQTAAYEIASARRDYASSHLLLGLLYARAGLLDEAERELRALQKANPDVKIVRRLLANVRALRR